MFSLLTGTPGAGKTLFAIDNFIKIANDEADEFKNIEYVYTNISGFKFDRFKDNKVKFDKLVFDSFYVHLKVLYSLFIQNENKDNLDEILQNYCKEHNILNAYFVIDECHNYFDNQDKVKNWWFTYHRHLNHEILLITQNKSLINPQYRNIPEIFIKAQPRSKAISKNVLRYFNYTEYRMTQKFSTTEITINDTYFDLYTSGNKSNQKLVGKKYIYMFIIFFISLISLFVLFIYQLFYNNTTTIQQEPKKEQIQTPINNPVQPTNQATQQSNNQTNQTILNTNVIQEESTNLKLFKFNCFKNFCYYKQDNKNSLEIPMNILISFFKNIDVNRKYYYKENNRLVVYLLIDEDKFIFLQGVRNDKEKNIVDNLGLGELSK